MSILERMSSRAFQVTQRRSMRIEGSRRGFLLAVTLAVLLPHALGGATEADSDSVERPIAEFDVGKEGRPLLLPVRIGDRKVEFLLDTGAAKTTFDVSLDSVLGPSLGETVLLTSAGSLRTTLHRCPAATVGELDLSAAATVAVADLSGTRYATGEDIRGVLGMDFLSPFALEIDFDKGKVRFWRTAPKLWSESSARIPLEFVLKCPTIEVRLAADLRERFYLDTGANVSSVSEPVFDQLLRDQALVPTRERNVITVAGEKSSASGYLKSLRVVDFEHAMVRADRDPTSALGLRFLARYRARFDFSKSVVYLSKSRNWDADDPRATSGLSIFDVGGRKIVSRVRSGSPGEIAGVRAGDIVERIDGDPAADLDQFRVGELLTTTPGREVSLELVRDGEPLQTKLELQSLIDEQP